MEKQSIDDHLKIQHHAIEISTMANSIEYGTCARTFDARGFGRSFGMLMNRKICALTNTYSHLDEYSWKNFIEKRIRTTRTNSKTITVRKVIRKERRRNSIEENLVNIEIASADDRRRTSDIEDRSLSKDKYFPLLMSRDPF